MLFCFRASILKVLISLYNFPSFEIDISTFSGLNCVLTRPDSVKLSDLLIKRTLQILSDYEQAEKLSEEFYDEHFSSVLNKRKILIIDDDMRTLFSIMSGLDRYGCHILTGKTGHEGIQRLDQYPDIDIVLMDIIMPDLDGYSIIKDIRSQERFNNLPVIALADRTIKDDRARCINAGASEYILKPVDMKSLLAMVKIWLTFPQPHACLS